MMEAAMSALSMLVFLGVVMITGQLCRCTASAGAGGGFSVEFIHRDSPRSPYHDPALTAHGRMLAAARRSAVSAVQVARSRGGAAPAPSGAQEDVVSKVISRPFEYLMAVNVGTPPIQVLAIADTGSDLVWIKCNGGGDGGNTTEAGAAVVYDPAASSTYRRVSCQSDACQAINDASCDAESNCRYLYAYGDGSRTAGVLSTESFTFDEADTVAGAGRRRQLHVPSVNFGCSTETAGTFRADGLVGLGGGAVSLVTQLCATESFARKFSYCLVPYGVNASSTLNFGAHANVSEPGAATTALVASDIAAYYTVLLDSAKVGGRAVSSAGDSSSRIIVDSGTTLTFLDVELLGPLVNELSRRITLPRAESPEKLLQLCYDVSGRRDGAASIPDVTLVFGGGAAVTLRAENTFVLVQEGILCLALVATSERQPVSILGNIAQQNLHVGYDLDARTITFAAADCARSGAVA